MHYIIHDLRISSAVRNLFCREKHEVALRRVKPLSEQYFKHRLRTALFVYYEESEEAKVKCLDVALGLKRHVLRTKVCSVSARPLKKQKNAIKQAGKHSCTVLICSEEILLQPNVREVFSAIAAHNLCFAFLPEGPKEFMLKDFIAASPPPLKAVFENENLVLESKEYFHEEECELGKILKFLREARA